VGFGDAAPLRRYAMDGWRPASGLVGACRAGTLRWLRLREFTIGDQLTSRFAGEHPQHAIQRFADRHVLAATNELGVSRGNCITRFRQRNVQSLATTRDS